jgi:AcrR family transcriptional regulator
MENAYRRKKQPELVRRALLEAAAHLAVEEGLAAVTIQAVATVAGVTKGGLLHHFPSKQALIEAVFSDLLEQLDTEIDRYMAQDDEPRGSFTRAYVEAMFLDYERGDNSPWAPLSVSMVTDPSLRLLWREWLERRLIRHRETDNRPALKVVRLAADGVWFALLLNTESVLSVDLAGLRAQLIAMTQEA